jgi:hypothetical protein
MRENVRLWLVQEYQVRVPDDYFRVGVAAGGVGVAYLGLLLEAQQPKNPEPPADKGKPAEAAKEPEKPDKGDVDVQAQRGIAYQSNPGQVGEVFNLSVQTPNFWTPALTRTYGPTQLQWGVLQPVANLQLTQLSPLAGVSRSASQPSPPPSTAQLSFTVTPIIFTIGPSSGVHLSVTTPLGLAGAYAFDPFGTTSGPGASGTHGQILGIGGGQADLVVGHHVSFTLAGGGQAGADHGPGGWSPTIAGTASFVINIHGFDQQKP